MNSLLACRYLCGPCTTPHTQRLGRSRMLPLRGRLGRIAVQLALLLLSMAGGGRLFAQKSRLPLVQSVGLSAGAAYGHNAMEQLSPWHALVIGGGPQAELNLFRWHWLKLGLGLSVHGEFYFLPVEEKPFYLGSGGYLRLFSLRLESRFSFYPLDFLYFGPGSSLSLTLTGNLGDKERGIIRHYQPFFVPYATLHVGYKHRRPLFGRIAWAVELNAGLALNNEVHLELGSSVRFAYQMQKNSRKAVRR
ncbi:MAG: hypothetical protein AAF975_05520 [Spirochaetota bacterium]